MTTPAFAKALRDMKRAAAGRRPGAELARRCCRPVDAEKVRAPSCSWLRRSRDQTAKRDGQLRGPCRWRADHRGAEVVAAPREILHVPAAIAPQHEIEHGVERIHLDLEIARAVAGRIEKHLDHLLFEQRRVALRQRRPRIRVGAVKEHAQLVRRPADFDARGLLRRGAGDRVAQRERGQRRPRRRVGERAHFTEARGLAKRERTLRAQSGACI